MCNHTWDVSEIALVRPVSDESGARHESNDRATVLASVAGYGLQSAGCGNESMLASLLADAMGGVVKSQQRGSRCSIAHRLAVRVTM